MNLAVKIKHAYRHMVYGRVFICVQTKNPANEIAGFIMCKMISC